MQVLERFYHIPFCLRIRVFKLSINASICMPEPFCGLLRGAATARISIYPIPLSWNFMACRTLSRFLSNLILYTSGGALRNLWCILQSHSLNTLYQSPDRSKSSEMAHGPIGLQHFCNQACVSQKCAQVLSSVFSETSAVAVSTPCFA
jgi:hypothetical protein